MVVRRRLVTSVVAALLSAGVVVAGGWAAPASAAFSTQASPSWVPNDTVKTMVRSGNVVYLGGSFTSLTNPANGAQVTRSRVAAINATTGVPLAWNPGANGLVDAIAVAPDGTVYLGGDFTSVAGRTATRLAAVTPGGAPVAGFGASADNTVHDLYADASSLYVGGRFQSVNGTSRPRLVRLDRSSGALTDFNARVVGGRVDTVAPAADGQALLLGGTFSTVGGQPRAFAASVARSTGAVTGWRAVAPCGSCPVIDIVASGASVYAAVGGPGGRAVAWNAGTGALRWSRSADGNVQAVDVEAGVVVLRRALRPGLRRHPRHQLAALDASNGALLDYIVASPSPTTRASGRSRPTPTGSGSRAGSSSPATPPRGTPGCR